MVLHQLPLSFEEVLKPETIMSAAQVGHAQAQIALQQELQPAAALQEKHFRQFIKGFKSLIITAHLAWIELNALGGFKGAP